jgi:flagellar hook assembly protein FlgD
LASKPDLTGPQLVSVFPLSPASLQVVFNEKLDQRLPSPTSFHLTPEAEAAEVKFSDASLTSYLITLAAPLNGGTEYHLTVSGIFDCPGNVVQQDFNQLDFALPEPADSLDLVINELLFNPRPTGVDFVEVYNTSAKYINLKNWTLVNAQGTAKVITEEDLLIAPATYRVFTQDGNVLKGEYLSGKEDTFVEMTLPSLPDDEGTVTLQNDQQKVIDAFSYSEKMHSPFVSDAEGVSLERISFSEATDLIQNWKSASATAGFATPGYVNSNALISGVTDESLSVEPEVFMPQYGQPNFTQIHYNFDEGGYVATVRILDAQGREIKKLANNALLGSEGFLRWDGDQENGSQARIGAYMIWFEIVDAEGIVKSFRKRVVVAEKF